MTDETDPWEYWLGLPPAPKPPEPPKPPEQGSEWEEWLSLLERHARPADPPAPRPLPQEDAWGAWLLGLGVLPPPPPPSAEGSPTKGSIPNQSALPPSPLRCLIPQSRQERLMGKYEWMHYEKAIDDSIIETMHLADPSLSEEEIGMALGVYRKRLDGGASPLSPSRKRFTEEETEV